MAFQFSKPLASSKELVDNLSTGFKVLAAIVAGCSAIIGAALTVDARYAHQDDFLAFQKNHEAEEQQRHKHYLEERIGELAMKSAIQQGKLDTFDSMILDKYKQEIQDLK